MAHNAVTAGTNNITFQIQLDLVSGAVYFVYPDVLWGNVTYDAAANATVGVQFSSTSAAQYSLNTASLTDGQVNLLHACHAHRLFLVTFDLLGRSDHREPLGFVHVDHGDLHGKRFGQQWLFHHGFSYGQRERTHSS
ncbi:MAG: hypothetical protein V9F04_05265 [Dermatophilaceae bacterium]